MTNTLLLLFIGLTVAKVGMCFRPVCREPFEWIRDPKDCAHHWRCVWQRPVEMPRCPSGTILNKRYLVCVYRNSIWDDCDEDDSGNTIQERCEKGETLIPHPEECQLYYNCSLVYREIPRFFEQYLTECPYPSLFSQSQRRCVNFDQGDCGRRKEPKTGCEYRRNWCPTSHCIPCSVTYPSCKGKGNGNQVYEGREWSPYYVECKSERTISQKTCKADTVFETARLFSPVTKRCENLYRIPRSKGGLEPRCDGKFNGAYPTDQGNLKIQYICQDGRLKSIRWCPGNKPDPEPRSLSVCVYG